MRHPPTIGDRYRQHRLHGSWLALKATRRRRRPPQPRVLQRDLGDVLLEYCRSYDPQPINRSAASTADRDNPPPGPSVEQ
jgi:hypothetical protein